MTDQKKTRSLVTVIIDAPVWEFELPANLRTERDKKARPVSPGSVKYVALELAKHFNRDRNGDLVWPSLEMLSGLTGIGINTVRAALHQLDRMRFIKIRSDFGKSNGYSMNEEIIRESLSRLTTVTLATHKAALRAQPDPSHHGRGQLPLEPDPSHGGRGTPPMVAPDPSHDGALMTKGMDQGECPTGSPSFGHSTFPKVGDGDHQRKMQLLGVVAEGARQALADAREQPMEEKQDEAGGLPKGARRVNERPG